MPRFSKSLNKSSVPPKIEFLDIISSPLESIFKNVAEIAAIPEDTATDAIPPSRYVILFSKEAVVGLLILQN